jgi:ankyrin repeat protein
MNKMQYLIVTALITSPAFGMEMPKKMVVRSAHPDFFEAVEKANLNKVTEMIEAGVDVDAIGLQCEPSLAVAINKGYARIVEALLKKADPNSWYSPEEISYKVRDETPLTLAAAHPFNDPKVTKKLLENGANANIDNKKGKYPYEIACEHDNLTIAACLRPHTKPKIVAKAQAEYEARASSILRNF